MNEDAESQFLPLDEAKWRRCFHQFDIDSRGTLDHEQFLSMLVSEGVPNENSIYMALPRDQEGAPNFMLFAYPLHRLPSRFRYYVVLAS